ncbi:MAG: peptidoglycan-binding domain-containing protein [Candidatus Pacebacteria bacterium]|nr:peptidoglycan-binding domain-containing protein [Candidatus Paceibacterota bacterium]
MKKILTGLFVLSFLIIGIRFTQAEIQNGCLNGAKYDLYTGAECPISTICPPNMPSPKLCSDGSYSKIEPATKDTNGCTTSYKFICPTIDDGCSSGAIFNLTTGQKCPVIDNGCNGNIKYSSITGLMCSNYKGTENDNGCASGRTYNMYTGEKCPIVNDGCDGTIKYSLNTGLLCTNYRGNEIDNGCSNGKMYNMYTGEICPVKVVEKVTTKEGCMNGEVYSRTTGEKCPANINQTTITDNGCQPGFVYSLTTGQKCQSTSINNYCSSNTLMSKLMIGSSGDQEKSLQSILNSLGYLDDYSIDGKFGKGTRSAVMAFQSDNGLTSDGIVGIQTRELLNLKWYQTCSSSSN